MEKETISKELEAALNDFQAKNNQVPDGYFDQFELDLMHKIHTNTKLPKKAKLIALFTAQKKYIVAASILFAIATGFLFYNQLNRNLVAQEALVQIETLPDAAIEAYVNNNELLVEVDWNSEIEITGASVTLKNY